jgi:hypothetical protein
MRTVGGVDGGSPVISRGATAFDGSGGLPFGAGARSGASGSVASKASSVRGSARGGGVTETRFFGWFTGGSRAPSRAARTDSRMLAAVAKRS